MCYAKMTWSVNIDRQHAVVLRNLKKQESQVSEVRGKDVVTNFCLAIHTRHRMYVGSFSLGSDFTRPATSPESILDIANLRRRLSNSMGVS